MHQAKSEWNLEKQVFISGFGRWDIFYFFAQGCTEPLKLTKIRNYRWGGGGKWLADWISKENIYPCLCFVSIGTFTSVYHIPYHLPFTFLIPIIPLIPIHLHFPLSPPPFFFTFSSLFINLSNSHFHCRNQHAFFSFHPLPNSHHALLSFVLLSCVWILLDGHIDVNQFISSDITENWFPSLFSFK